MPVAHFACCLLAIRDDLVGHFGGPLDLDLRLSKRCCTHPRIARHDSKGRPLAFEGTTEAGPIKGRHGLRGLGSKNWVAFCVFTEAVGRRDILGCVVPDASDHCPRPRVVTVAEVVSRLSGDVRGMVILLRDWRAQANLARVTHRPEPGRAPGALHLLAFGSAHLQDRVGQRPKVVLIREGRDHPHHCP
eukprot:scaffold127835_cov24-Tisochrysis_lutea.AAC.2